MTCIAPGDGNAGLEKRRCLPVKFTQQIKTEIIGEIIVRTIRGVVGDGQVQKQDFVRIRPAKGIFGTAVFQRHPGLHLGRIKPRIHLGQQRLGPRRHFVRRVLFLQQIAEDVARDKEIALAETDIRHQHLGKLRARVDKKHPLQRRGRAVKIAGGHLLLEQREIQLEIGRVVKYEVDQVTRRGLGNGGRRGRRRGKLQCLRPGRACQPASSRPGHIHGRRGTGKIQQAGPLLVGGCRKLGNRIGEPAACIRHGRRADDGQFGRGGCHRLVQHQCRYDDVPGRRPACQNRQGPIGLAPCRGADPGPLEQLYQRHRRDRHIATAKLQLRRQHHPHLVLPIHPPDPGQCPRCGVKLVIGKLPAHGGIGQVEIGRIGRHKRPVRARGKRCVGLGLRDAGGQAEHGNKAQPSRQPRQAYRRAGQG